MLRKIRPIALVVVEVLHVRLVFAQGLNETFRKDEGIGVPSVVQFQDGFDFHRDVSRQ